MLEALRCGLPILTTDVGDTRNVITNMVNGVLLREWNEVEAASQLSSLLVDEKLRDSLSKGATTYAENQLWTWSERIQAEIMLVENLLKDK